MKYVIADENATKEFIIPVTWESYGTIKVKANSLERAIDFVSENPDDCPLPDNAQYVDGSYEVSGDGDIEFCKCFQEKKKVESLTFSCEEPLSKYVDSMLFPSGTGIASGTYSYEGRKIFIDLFVRGEVDITYKRKRYTDVSSFPEELIQLIKENRNWMDDEDVYICHNNWFEYLYFFDSEKCYEDGIMCEEKLADMDANDLYLAMLHVAEDIAKAL